jgi:hypothetical protein
LANLARRDVVPSVAPERPESIESIYRRRHEPSVDNLPDKIAFLLAVRNAMTGTAAAKDDLVD